MTQATGPTLDAIADYYTWTEIDYKIVWNNEDNLAFHFGYYGTGVTRHRDALTNANRVLSDIAAIQPGERVLDAGCGVGGSCFWLAANRGAEVVGVALGTDAIGTGRRLARERGLEHRVQFERADFTDLPYPDASFDVVWALESLCHAEAKAAFYREASRVLRPGGRLVVAEFMRRSRDLDDETEGMLRTWARGWAIPDLDTAAEHLDGAASAGLACVEVTDFTPSVRRSLRRLYHRAVAAIPVNAVLYAAGLRNGVQYANVISSLLQYKALRRGAWFYGILRAEKPQ